MTPAVIVDYGLGNLFSIAQACRVAGLPVELTDDADRIAAASLVILPGVGSFGDAMAALRARDLVEPIKDFAAAGRPLFGVCLGMQLLMDESQEFGVHRGLGLIAGTVERLPDDQGLKVPLINWMSVWKSDADWSDSPLHGLNNGDFFYFVHSYHVKPARRAQVCGTSRFGGFEYCSAVRQGSVFGVQFHPERSGPVGLKVYKNLVQLASNQ